MKLAIIFTGIALISLMSVHIFGADRALSVGIDEYKNPKIPKIEGGIADALAMEKLLLEKFGFKKDEIRILTGQNATTENIRDGFKNWLIRDSRPGDRIFFFYNFR